jgi:hypothetical protein
MIRLLDGNGQTLKVDASLTPFQDGQLADIAVSLGVPAYGEPTALLSDDSSQIDIWFSCTPHPVYGYSTDGATFTFALTDVPVTYLRPHMVKDGSTYYLYTVGSGDTSMHLFTSTDKIHFTDQGQVLAIGGVGAWDHNVIANPFVWKEGAGSWYMLYEANSAGPPSNIGLATAAAPQGPWTKYGGNPVILGAGNGCGNPELPRMQSIVTKHAERYYCYFHGQTASNSGHLGRAYSTDLHAWTVEGDVGGEWICCLPLWNGVTGWTYGDQCLVQFKGRTYLFWSPSNQVDASHIDGAVDSRPEDQLLDVPPSGSFVTHSILTT